MVALPMIAFSYLGGKLFSAGLVGGPVGVAVGAVVGGGAGAIAGASTTPKQIDLGKPIWDKK